MTVQFIDSHCHLDFADFQDDFENVIARMRANQVVAGLCPGVDITQIDTMMALIDRYPMLYGAIAVHPNTLNVPMPTVDELVTLGQLPKIQAIGETGLDYHYHQGDMTWQHERFRNHIRAAKILNKPLIIHCREAASDVIRILKEEAAHTVGGVMHCFSESIEVAETAMDMGFYISFSGVVTFKSAKALREVARQIPLERLLIETDSPYLAPTPYRGKTNEPAYVVYVARQLADVLSLPIETIAQATTDNFCRLFNIDRTKWETA